MIKQTSFLIAFLSCILFATHPLYAKENIADPKKIVREKREVLDFNKIDIAGTGHLYLKQGNKETLIIEGELEVLHAIKSNIENNTLHLGPKNSSFNYEGPLNYHLTVKNLEEINASGVITVSGRDFIVSDHLKISTNGTEKVGLKVKTNKLNTQISGNGEVIIQGEATTHTIEIAGAGELNGKKLLTKTSTITISGAGIASVNASTELDVKIYGAGKIQYYGKPKITQEISGSGEIIPLG